MIGLTAWRDCINILIMTTGIDSKRIGSLTFIHLRDPVAEPYYLQCNICCMYLIKHAVIEEATFIAKSVLNSQQTVQQLGI